MTKVTNKAAVVPMTSRERTASLSLAGIFALRMLGLFLILPVFAVWAQTPATRF